MQELVKLLPLAHIAFVFFLVVTYIFRGALLALDSPKAQARSMISLSSFLTLAVFFTGIALAFLMKLPFSEGFVLTKIFGLLIFVALGVSAFLPGMQKTPALVLLAVGICIFIYLLLIAAQRLQPLF